MSDDLDNLTVERFLEIRFDLPDAGQWAELESGRVRMLEPPSTEHGTVVLNLSKALAEFFTPDQPAYACFDLGLVLRRNPDTVRFPAVSIYTSGDRFAELDRSVTDRRPDLVVEIASDPDRLMRSTERAIDYHGVGISRVWVIDPVAQSVRIHPAGADEKRLSGKETVTEEELLPGFSVTVQELFREPEWWISGGRVNGSP